MDGFIFNIQRYSIDDGPGIRSTVFVKGCAMRCPWCSNPESISGEPQLLHRFTTCTKCGDCVAACDKGAISFDPEKGPKFDRELCDICGKCAWECIAQAIKISGETMSVEKVWKALKKDMVYYEESGGGVTCSGGEILLQPEFVNELFKKCRENGVHTCADTAGFGSPEALDLVLEYADLVYFDLKWIDPKRHEELTGVPIEPVIRNFKTICERGIPVVVRVPLIPEFDDTDANLDAIALFVKENAPGAQVHIMPYHRYGESKYESLGIEYPLKGLRENTPEDLARARGVFENEGVSVEVK